MYAATNLQSMQPEGLDLDELNLSSVFTSDGKSTKVHDIAHGQQFQFTKKYEPVAGKTWNFHVNQECAKAVLKKYQWSSMPSWGSKDKSISTTISFKTSQTAAKKGTKCKISFKYAKSSDLTKTWFNGDVDGTINVNFSTDPKVDNWECKKLRTGYAW